MNRKKNKKNACFFIGICLILILGFLIRSISFKQSNLSKLVNPYEKKDPQNGVSQQSDKSESEELKEKDNLEISFNQEDLIEQQNWISAKEAGEAKQVMRGLIKGGEKR